MVEIVLHVNNTAAFIYVWCCSLAVLFFYLSSVKFITLYKRILFFAYHDNVLQRQDDEFISMIHTAISSESLSSTIEFIFIIWSEMDLGWILYFKMKENYILRCVLTMPPVEKKNSNILLESCLPIFISCLTTLTRRKKIVNRIIPSQMHFQVALILLCENQLNSVKIIRTKSVNSISIIHCQIQ